MSFLMSQDIRELTYTNIFMCIHILARTQLTMLDKMMVASKNIALTIDGSSSTPMHFAARYGRLAIVKVSSCRFSTVSDRM